MAKLDIEQTKIFNDYIKHLNTLSTGSILLLVTFLEKIFVNPSGKWLVIVSLICFLLSVIGGVALKTILTLLAYFGGDEDNVSETVDNIRGIAIFLLWIGFLFGLISLAIFGIVNLL